MWQSIGTVSQFARRQDLQRRWEQKKAQGPTIVGMAANSTGKTPSEVRHEMKVSAITGKLKAGLTLSAAELEYIRATAPALYEKAMKIASEREGHRKALQQAKTRDDAQAIHTSKLHRIAEDAKTGGQDPEFTQMRIAGMQSEYHSFQKGEGHKLESRAAQELEKAKARREAAETMARIEAEKAAQKAAAEERAQPHPASATAEQPPDIVAPEANPATAEKLHQASMRAAAATALPTAAPPAATADVARPRTAEGSAEAPKTQPPAKGRKRFAATA